MAEYRKKLIEVVLPLTEINEGSKPETENPFLKGHPRSIHNWWARTPLSVCRALLFAQIIDDPDSAEARRRLLEIVRRLATWDALRDTSLLNEARELIQRQFNGVTPEFWDMFAGRGSIPLEAHRLGLKVTASDLNPVAVLIDRALLEIPSRFCSKPPVCPEAERAVSEDVWNGTKGLAEDIACYGRAVQTLASTKLGHLYGDVEVSTANAAGRPDLEQYIGRQLTPLAWIWARTIQCPNPGCRGRMPMVASFVLSKKKGVFIQPLPDGVTQSVDMSQIRSSGTVPEGTTTRTGATCLLCRTKLNKSQVREQASQFGLTCIPLAVVCDGERECIYLPFTPADIPDVEKPVLDAIDQPITDDRRWFSPPLYGLPRFIDLFTPRQLFALSVFVEGIQAVREVVVRDAEKSGTLPDDGRRLAQGGQGPVAYGDAIATYLTCALSRLTDYSCSIATWNPTNENVRNLFQRQAIPMAWDFAEANIVSGKLSFENAIEWVIGALSGVPTSAEPARVLQIDARRTSPEFKTPPIVSTDPPYFDNIGYADLSDFFYVWLRHSLGKADPQLFATVLTPKEPELIASRYRHGGSEEAAEQHFREGFAAFYERLTATAHPDFPVTIYYAFKQSETDEEGDGQNISTGWESMLEGLVDAGFQVTGTWPVRTTKKARSVARGTNALASAVVIVCRRRSESAGITTRREFIRCLKNELPEALKNLQQGNIAPVDLAQAAIGPGMAVLTRYARVMETDGSMTVRAALGLINQVLDEVLAEQEGDFDSDTRWALAWFEQYGMSEGPFGEAETLSRAKNTAVNGLVQAGIVMNPGGKVRLVRPDELDASWDPNTDTRLTAWEATHHLVRTIESDGEAAAARLINKLGGMADIARELAYRLYSICERKKWADDALKYNGLVIAWPELTKLAVADRTRANVSQAEMF